MENLEGPRQNETSCVNSSVILKYTKQLLDSISENDYEAYSEVRTSLSL